MDTLEINLRFGHDGVFQTSVPQTLVAVHHTGPSGLVDVASQVAAALATPLEFPALKQSIVAGDRVILALDRDTPIAATLIRAVWDVLEAQNVDPHDVLILQPASITADPLTDPRCELPPSVREAMRWDRHDASNDDGLAYLAATTAGDRIYLARDVIDADFVLPIGTIAFDSVLGHRGTNSVLYPGLSNAKAISKSRGLGHDELGPSELRGLRQTIDEVGWLLGVQFTLQVIPGTGTTAAHVIAGAGDAVFRKGQSLLNHDWTVTVDERVDFVIVAVDADAAGHDWAQVGAALETARRLVAKEGRILVLSQLDSPLTPGLELLQASRTPRDALQPLRQAAPDDLIIATQFAKAADWAKVYLLSNLDNDTVEELFAVPLSSVEEATRLVETADRMAIISSAQHVFGKVSEG